MNRVVLKVDQWVSIGKDLGVSPTDIDPTGVRLIARGRILGGPDDGAEFEHAHELTIGSSVNLSPHAAVTLVEVRGKIARLDLFVPANVAVKTHGK